MLCVYMHMLHSRREGSISISYAAVFSAARKIQQFKTFLFIQRVQ